MNKRKVAKLKESLEQMRLHPQGRSSKDFQKIAAAIGRKLSSVRNNEPTWIREQDPELSPPLSIPNHSGDMPVGTARSIIDALLSDLDSWEIYLDNSGE